jgi:hypothetical protein
MSFGGSVLAMIISLRNNARPKRKFFENYKELDKQIKIKSNKLPVKEIPAEELEIIKGRIRLQAKRDNTRLLYAKWGFIIIVVIFTSLLSWKLYQVYRLEEDRAQSKEVEKSRLLNEEFMILINDGYDWLNKGNIHNAKFLFKEASGLMPGDYRARVATLRAFVYDCLQNGITCKTTEHLMNQCLNDYPDDKVVIELATILDFTQ